MKSFHRKTTLGAAIVILGLATFTACSPGDPVEKADARLREMSDFLAGAEAFKVSARQELAIKDSSTVMRDIDLTVQHPNKLRAESSGDQGTQTTVFDGDTLTVLYLEEKVWAALKAPGDIDAMVDLLAEENEMHIFLADLLAASPFESLTVGGITGTHEKAELDGEKCHHLAFGNELVDWQLWIPVSGDPLPRKFHISYKDDNALYSSFTAHFGEWTMNPELNPDTFTASIPEGFEEIEFITRRSS